MDLKGSLVNNHLRIYPSEYFTTFLKSLPDDTDIPINILKIIGKNRKGNLNEDIAQGNKVHLTDEDLKNINNIASYVKANAATSESVKTTDDSKDEEIEHHKEKEKSGDTPEKSKSKDMAENHITDKKKSKMKSKHINNVEENNDSNKEDAVERQDMENSTEENDEPFLLTHDIDWLYFHLQKRRSKGDDVPYMHNLLEGANVELPENEIIKRNPELEARCVKLRAQEEARAYRRMTKGVDNVRMRFPEDSISYQMKQLNRHLIAIGQFIISIFAGFMFGFKGIEWTIGHLDFGFRLLLGVICALIIALAEIYFLAKKLNEELNVPETVQLGGPVKFADEPKYRHLPSKPLGNNTRKEHQD